MSTYSPSNDPFRPEACAPDILTGQADHALGQLMVYGAEAAANQPIVAELHTIPGMPKGFFNAAAWEEADRTYLLGRYVDKPGEPGDGDPGAIMLLTLEAGAVVAKRTVWQPAARELKADRLEDTRAIRAPDGSLTITLSRLAINPATGQYAPYPARVVTLTDTLLKGEFPPTFHMRGLGDTALGSGEHRVYVLAGKNATPIDNPSGHDHFMVRAEAHDHTFVVYTADKDNNAQRLQHLEIPEDQIPWWGKRRMGTTMPPVWLNSREALLFVHGLQMIKGKPRYTFGTARLLYANGRYSIDNVSADPILTPERIAELFPGQRVQLHAKERIAAYWCGGIVKRGPSGSPMSVDGYVSVGDRRTALAIFNVIAATANWVRPEELAA